MATITKKELIDRIADATKHRRVQVKRVVQQFLDEIIAELGKGNRLEFRDFGVFETKIRKARRAQNPKTMAPVDVPEKRTVKFKVGRLMKQRLTDLTGVAIDDEAGDVSEMNDHDADDLDENDEQDEADENDDGDDGGESGEGVKGEAHDEMEASLIRAIFGRTNPGGEGEEHDEIDQSAKLGERDEPGKHGKPDDHPESDKHVETRPRDGGQGIEQQDVKRNDGAKTRKRKSVRRPDGDDGHGGHGGQGGRGGAA